MLQLKEYQQRTLDALKSYFQACVSLGNADTAFYDITRQVFGTGIPYRNVKELPGLPYVCLRVPTGGGKTLVACHSVSIAANDLLRADNPLVLWLVPSNAIREQTINALKDRAHPYRKALDATMGSVEVMSIQDALYVQRSTLDTETTIIVSTMQAFRVDDTEGRRVYDQSGALMDHFTGIDESLLQGLDRHENGKPVPSLANVLKLRRPVVIVDEAHNARTELSFETLARFNPACIIEFTATPNTHTSPSNVLHSVSAAELKAEAMIKMPIRLETRTNWKELLSDAIGLRNHLEKAAKEERGETGEYIRPIMLIQAQPRHQHQETLTVEVVEKCLIADFNIPDKQIRRATGSDRGLEGIDLAEPSCEVRYIITVQALREGWDCPFAYVLCSVAEMRSSTAVEQILGRIMRLPKAAWKKRTELNMAYAFSASQNFIEAANALEDALVQNGFNRQEAKEFISQAPAIQQDGFEGGFWGTTTFSVPETPNLALLPEEIAPKVTYDEVHCMISIEGIMGEAVKESLEQCFGTPEGKASVERAYRKNRGLPADEKGTPSERGEIFSVPQLAVKNGNLFEIFEETHFLDVPWSLSKCDGSLTEAEYVSSRADGQLAEIDVSDKGQIATRFISGLQLQMNYLANEHGETPALLVHWIDRTIHHPDITPEESGAFITKVVRHLIDERKISLEFLFHDKYRLRQVIEARLDQHRKNAHEKAYQTFLLPECATPLTVTPEVCFSYDTVQYPYNMRYQGAYAFRKHYYPYIGDLKPAGEEFECAKFIDALPEVKFWVRNLERRPSYSFWLQTSTDRFYPDFVCLLNDGRYLVVEYKGEDRWSNDDSKEKRDIGGLWAARSDGTCLFVMPKGKDFTAIQGKLLP